MSELIIYDIIFLKGVDCMRKFILSAFMIMLFAAGYTASADSLVLPDDITVIDDYAFYQCANLTGELVIPGGVTHIGAHAFDGCTGLTGQVIIPGSVSYIDETAFLNTSLELIGEQEYWQSKFEYEIVNGKAIITGFLSDSAHNLLIPDTLGGCPVTELGRVFNGDTKLTGTLTLPKYLEKIAPSTFAFCTGLTGDLIIPDSVTTIGELAFSYCDGFDGKLVLPKSLVTIGNGAFDRCTSLKCDGLVIPEGVKKIGTSAFYMCSGFSGELVLPEGIEDIGNDAFAYVDFSGRLKLPSTLKYIRSGAFSYTGFSGELVLPEGLKHIGSRAFYLMNILGDVIVPSSVEYIGNKAFDYWFGEINVIYPREYELEFEYWVYEYADGDELVWLNGCNNHPVENIQLPVKLDNEPVYGVRDFAIMDCDKITGKLVIPEGYREIGMAAFARCTGITGVPELPSTLEYIGSQAFEDCSGLSGTLVIADNVRIDGAPFDGTNLTVYQNGKVIYSPD